eukprot:160859_1
MPVDGMTFGQAVVAANGKIYIGGFFNPTDYQNKVLEFNPADETITEVASLNENRHRAAFIYIKENDQICALTGFDFNTGKGIDSWECSNEIGSGGTCT